MGQRFNFPIGQDCEEIGKIRAVLQERTLRNEIRDKS